LLVWCNFKSKLCFWYVIILQNSFAAMNLLRLAEMTAQSKWKEQSAKIFTFFKEYEPRTPYLFLSLSLALFLFQ
jgi:hypothetical protein